MVTSNNQLFAGNGLQTISYSWLEPKVIQTNCTTYDDCYSLLCSYLIQPVYKVTIIVNDWDGECGDLAQQDDRTLKSLLTIGNETFNAGSVSNNSFMICTLHSGLPDLSIDFVILDCDF